jgi:hypothetical protein
MHAQLSHLFPWIYHFNHLSVYHVHPSWYQTLPFADYYESWSTVKNKLFAVDVEFSEYINTELLDCRILLDFQAESRRLLLVPHQEIFQLSRQLGLIRLGGELRKSIDGAFLKRAQQDLGAEPFLFAKKQSAFYYGKLLESVTPVTIQTLKETELMRLVDCFGFQLLWRLFAQDEAIYQQAFCHKFSKTLSLDMPRTAFISQEETDFLIKIIRKIIKQMGWKCLSIFD